MHECSFHSPILHGFEKAAPSSSVASSTTTSVLSIKRRRIRNSSPSFIFVTAPHQTNTDLYLGCMLTKIEATQHSYVQIKPVCHSSLHRTTFNHVHGHGRCRDVRRDGGGQLRDGGEGWSGPGAALRVRRQAGKHSLTASAKVWEFVQY